MRYDDRLFPLSTDRRLTTTRAVNGVARFGMITRCGRPDGSMLIIGRR